MENKIYLNSLESGLIFTNSDDKLNIEGYACHFGVRNLNDEIVYKDSFNTFFDAYANGKITPILNHEHDNKRIIGGIDDVLRDDTGLYIKAHINKNVKYCDEWLIPNILAGDVSAFSTEGYVVGGYDGILINSDGTYTVKDMMLTAVAVVARPADVKAEFSVRNYVKDIERAKNKWFLYV